MSKPRYIERSFPIVQLNPLSQRERNAFKPIYKMHKWFARRSPSIFRAILLASALPYEDENGERVDLMKEFYEGHANDPRLKREDGTPLRVLDPFMGGGTTVVEALRLGFDVTGLDYNPIAWFIVKGETTPVDLDELQAAYEQVASEVKEEILDLYRTPCPVTGEPADIIYAFWVKQGICVDPECKHVTDLFKSYVVGRIQGDLGVRYLPDVTCPHCEASFDLELERCTITAGGVQLMGSKACGKSRPEPQLFSTARTDGSSQCPSCSQQIDYIDLPSHPKPKKKKVLVQVLVDPSTGEFFECRGQVPEELRAPSGYVYSPTQGPAASGKFTCEECGKKQAVVESARAYGQPLPFRYYGYYAHTPHLGRDAETRRMSAERGLPTNNCKWFAAATDVDLLKIGDAESLLREHAEDLPTPHQEIYDGYNTNRLVIHQYKRWSETFGARSLYSLALVLRSIAKICTPTIRDALLGAFQSHLDYSSNLTAYHMNRNMIQRVTSAHDFRNPSTICENNVWGAQHGSGAFAHCVEKYFDGLRYRLRPTLTAPDGYVPVDDAKPERWQVNLASTSVNGLGAQVSERWFDLIVTDPPYAGSVQYAEMADWPYVWLHQVLREHYPEFEPELVLKRQEIIENGREKDVGWFFEKLTEAWRECHRVLKDDGLLVFTFHHKEGDRWSGLLRSLFDAGFYLVAAYPTHSEALNSIVIQATKGITYDIIHVCRKRLVDPEPIPWSVLRRDVQREAKAQLAELEAGGDVLPGPDVWMILLGRALHRFSQHYEQVLDHDGSVLDLDEAMARLRVLVREVRGESLPLPGALTTADGLSQVYLLHVVGAHDGWTRDGLHIELRGYGHSPDDLLDSGLIEVDPKDKHRWVPALAVARGVELGDGMIRGRLVDNLHQLLGAAHAGHDVEALVKRIRGWPLLLEGLRYVGKRDSQLRELAGLVARVIESLGPEPEPGGGQQALPFE